MHMFALTLNDTRDSQFQFQISGTQHSDLSDGVETGRVAGRVARRLAGCFFVVPSVPELAMAAPDWPRERLPRSFNGPDIGRARVDLAAPPSGHCEVST